MSDLFWTPQPGERCVVKETGERVVAERIVEHAGNTFAWVTEDRLVTYNIGGGRTRTGRPTHQTPVLIDDLSQAPVEIEEKPEPKRKAA